ncbi:MAG TPA: phosphonate C-P lyase system protein PhnL [Hyphomicrobiaceae bacterium]|nr:phosphonate C-P lyase system protein PhnL [Hyphomicrobiaceae bacterium]
MTPRREMIRLDDVAKTFVMHLRGGARLPVVGGVSFAVAGGECVVLGGPSGTGKSSILKMIYGNYRADGGRIEINGPAGWVDIARAMPRSVLALRKSTIGYVSQFLRVIPRIGALDIVMSAARETSLDDRAARARAASLLTMLHVPERLWGLPPATFSGGEQQRINIARGFAAERPILLLDEPTASLDATNRAAVVELIEARKRAGAAIVGIFHDEDVRDRVADRIIDVTKFTTEAPGR